MGPVVRRLILKNFRSVSSGHIDFDNPTFLVGLNGSGKSNIADALAFLSDAMISPLHEVLDRRGGLANLLHKTPNDLPAMLGMAVELDYGESLKIGIENFEDLKSDELGSTISSIHYAF